MSAFLYLSFFHFGFIYFGFFYLSFFDFHKATIKGSAAANVRQAFAD